MDNNCFKIDCQNCYGLCCSALYLSKVDGFIEDKKAGIRCTYLDAKYRCTIYQDLLVKGSKGCRIYDCFGAGQLVTKMYQTKENDKEIFNTYLLVYSLQEIGWYLLQAKGYVKEIKLVNKIEALLLNNQDLVSKIPLSKEVEIYLVSARKTLKEVCDSITKKDKMKKQTYFKKDFSYQNLDNRDFSMTIMIASNLEGSSLLNTNFLGADIRDVNLKNTDISHCLFLTQGQINSAIGNKNTKLPPHLTVPSIWQ